MKTIRLQFGWMKLCHVSRARSALCTLQMTHCSNWCECLSGGQQRFRLRGGQMFLTGRLADLWHVKRTCREENTDSFSTQVGQSQSYKCFVSFSTHRRSGNWFHPLIVSVHIKATSLFVFSPHRAFIMPPCTTALGSAASLKLNADITFSVFTLMCFSFSRQKYEQIAGEVSRHQHRAEPHRRTPQCYLWQAAFTQYISFFLYISCDWFSH